MTIDSIGLRDTTEVYTSLAEDVDHLSIVFQLECANGRTPVFQGHVASISVHCFRPVEGTDLAGGLPSAAYPATGVCIALLSHHPKMPENTYYFEEITAARSMLASEEDGLNRNATLSLDDYRRFIARRSWYFEKPWNPGDGAISACEGATLRRTIVTVTFSLSPGLAPWCPVR